MSVWKNFGIPPFSHLCLKPSRAQSGYAIALRVIQRFLSNTRNDRKASSKTELFNIQNKEIEFPNDN